MNGREHIETFLRLRAAWAALLHWWFATLLDMVPEAIRTVFADNEFVIINIGSAEVVVLSNGNVLRKAVISDLDQLAVKDGNIPAVVVLSDRSVFTSRFSVPASARSKLRQISAYELEQCSPYKINDVLFDFAVLHSSRSEKMLEVGLAIVTKETIERAQEIAFKLGFAPETITAEIEPNGKARYVFIKGTDRKNKAGHAPLVAFCAAMVFLLFVISTLAYGRLMLASKITSSLEQAKIEAEQGIKAKAFSEKLSAAIAVLVKRAQEPSAAEVLAELTRLLPEDSFLLSFDLSGNELRISGLSKKASSLIEMLSTSTLFSHPHFLSPITPQNGKDRFDLALAVKDRHGKGDE